MMRRPVSVLVSLLLVLGLSLAPEGLSAREVVAFDGYRPGTIVVKTSERRLYYALGNGQAVRYVVGVGRQGRQWNGDTRIARKVVNPTFAPPADVKRDNPSLPDLIPPGPNNPLGPRALVLAKGDYAIHGTNRPNSIGRFVSYGCIRMHNRDVIDLFERVRVGTPVVVRP
jgi:lipoprotein-anchoring transpeptidase ErfK/SrfK